MIKVVEISFMEPNKLVCYFNNDEERILDLAVILKDKYATKILSSKEVLETAQIGNYGEIFWPGIAEITILNGEIEPCNYDISPEFAYMNSQPKFKAARESS